MPRRTIFVRDDDLEDFEAIQNRPTWLHKAIRYADDIVNIPDEEDEPEDSDSGEPSL